MPPASYNDFFIACIGASASFIGLLFVAISVVLSRSDAGKGTAELEFTDRRLAESAFMALVDIFFVSLQAIMPSSNIGYVAIVMGILGIRSAFRIFSYRKETGAVLWLIGSILIYGFQITYSILLILHPTNIGDIDAIATLIMILFGSSLIRAWELTGIRKKG